MRIGPTLLVCGALTLGACGSSPDVQSTESFSNDSGDRLPPVDQPAATTPTPNAPTTLPGTRPVDFGSLVLLASDLPGWDVVRPIDVRAEATPQTFDCPDMTIAWAATGGAGIRSSGTTGGASFRNTAIELPTAEAAGHLLDAVDRVWTECTLFEVASDSFWSEPVAMPSSSLRTSGLAIGSDSTLPRALAFWQFDTTVVILEVEGDEMWTYLDPLLATLSARLDGAPMPIDNVSATTPGVDVPPENLPVIVPATQPTNELPTTTTTPIADPLTDSFPPSYEDWAEHQLAHLAPTPEEIGPGWEYKSGRRTQAEPADPNDAIEGCDAPVPPALDGYDLEYRNRQTQAEVAVMVGDGTAADSQIWIDAFRAIAACEPEALDYTGEFDIVEGEIEGADDAVIIAGDVNFDVEEKYFQVIGAARVDGIVVGAFVAVAVTDAQTADTAITDVRDLLASMLAAR